MVTGDGSNCGWNGWAIPLGQGEVERRFGTTTLARGRLPVAGIRH
jgi:hypothetical protein